MKTASKLALIIIAVLSFMLPLNAATYYINPVDGDDLKKGLSKENAIKSLERAGMLKLLPGDKLLLAGGMTHEGSLVLKDISGTENNPVIVSAYYNQGENAHIDAAGYRNGILLQNCSNIVVKNILITANGGGVKEEKRQDMRCGILVAPTRKGNYENIVLKNIAIKDVFFEDPGFNRGKDEVRSANGTQNYGWGIRFINYVDGALIDGVKIESCRVSNVAHTGIKFTARNRSIKNVKIYNNNVFETGGPGIQMSGVIGAHVNNNKVNYSGHEGDSRKWSRGSGLWTWSCTDVIIENNSFRNANGPGDSAGCHIDFNCTNVIVQYNLSENNAGGFCEILGNNHNCAYRYNVSINDGHRVKNKNGAFQEGKIFWLSGFVGKDRKRNGPFNSYFYNNTIYVKNDIVAKVAVDKASEGVLIANNIFYIEGESKAVLGDQYKPEKEGESRVENIVFKNNLFLAPGNWPDEVIIHDDEPLFGNPGFVNPGGKEIEDYISGNTDLIKDKGIVIQKIPGDNIGLFIGLNPKYDILGNEIKGLPDIGAIEMDKN